MPSPPSVTFTLLLTLSPLLLLLLQGILVRGDDGTISRYTYRDHPLYVHSQFSNSRPTPVIVRKYEYTYRDTQYVSRAHFFPRAMSYVRHASRKPFAKRVDVLAVPYAPQDASNRDVFLTVTLNTRARVIALIVGHGLGGPQVEGSPAVAGLPSGWKGLGGVVDAAPARTMLGETERWNQTLFAMPFYAVALEVAVPDDLVVTLPHPSTLSVAGIPGHHYTLLFGKAGSASPDAPLRAFRPPGLPTPFSPLRTEDTPEDLTVVNPAERPPVPNKTCPTWLHDLHVTRLHAGRPAGTTVKEGRGKRWETKVHAKEAKYWRTWHPMIDPIYWCYYDHEHGSYPTAHYRPAFGYTAFKTPDDTTDTGRQHESHAGFKIFSFPNTNEAPDHFVVITVHMHLSIARRFRERKHTVVFAVLDVRHGWRINMELSMKMDFGAAEVTYANKSTVPMNGEEWKVYNENMDRGRLASRRFNVLNIDARFPQSVDPTFTIKGDLKLGPLAVSNGLYEQWKAPLVTCSGSTGRLNRGFNFDVRDPSSAMRSLATHTDADLQWMNGKSINRILFISDDGVQVGPELCAFRKVNAKAVKKLAQKKGTFYTDSYMKKVVKGPANWAVRQILKAAGGTVDILPGHYTPVDIWSGWMEKEDDSTAKRRFRDIERAIVRAVN